MVFSDGVNPTNGVIEVDVDVTGAMVGTDVSGFTIIFGTSADTDRITFGAPAIPSSGAYSGFSVLSPPPPADGGFTQEVRVNTTITGSVMAVAGEILQVPFTIPAGILSDTIPLTFSVQPFRNSVSAGGGGLEQAVLQDGMVVVVPEPHAVLTCLIGVASLVTRRRIR